MGLVGRTGAGVRPHKADGKALLVAPLPQAVSPGPISLAAVRYRVAHHHHLDRLLGLGHGTVDMNLHRTNLCWLLVEGCVAIMLEDAPTSDKEWRGSFLFGSSWKRPVRPPLGPTGLGFAPRSVPLDLPPLGARNAPSFPGFSKQQRTAAQGHQKAQARPVSHGLQG